MPHLIALGINHQTAPVSLRERVAFSEEALPATLSALRALPGVEEVALLSTCNRTEVYALTDDRGERLIQNPHRRSDQRFFTNLYSSQFDKSCIDAVNQLEQIGRLLKGLVR